MKKQSENFHNTKFFFLLLFLFGMVLLGLFGYGYFSYGTFGNKIVNENPAILFVGIPFLSPYIIIVIYEYFWNKKNEKQEDDYGKFKIEKLLKIGIPLTIDFDRSVKEIRKLHPQDNLDLEILKYYLTYPFGELIDNFKELSNNETQVFTLVVLKYRIERKTYFKKFIIPFSKESTVSILTMQKSTILYYNQECPEESIVDLEFLDKYL